MLNSQYVVVKVAQSVSATLVYYEQKISWPQPTILPAAYKLPSVGSYKLMIRSTYAYDFTHIANGANANSVQNILNLFLNF